MPAKRKRNVIRQPNDAAVAPIPALNRRKSQRLVQIAPPAAIAVAIVPQPAALALPLLPPPAPLPVAPAAPPIVMVVAPPAAAAGAAVSAAAPAPVEQVNTIPYRFEWVALNKYSLQHACHLIGLIETGNKTVLIDRLITARANRDIFSRVTTMMNSTRKPAPVLIPADGSPPQLSNPARPLSQPRSRKPMQSTIPFIRVPDDKEDDPSMRQQLNEKDAELTSLRERFDAFELLQAPRIPLPRIPHAAYAAVVAASAAAAAAGTDGAATAPHSVLIGASSTSDRKDWTAMELQLLNTLDDSSRNHVIMSKLMGSNVASFNSSLQTSDGGNTNSAAYAWLQQDAALKKYSGIVDAKDVKSAVNGEYIDLQRFLVRTAPSFLYSHPSAAVASSSSTAASSANSYDNSTPIQHPAFSQFVINQTTIPTTQTMELSLGVSGSNSMPMRMVNAPKVSFRGMNSLDDWREAVYVYMDIVQSRPSNSRYLPIFWKYQFDFGLLVDAIGFQRAYEFDCKWRRRQSGFKDLNIEHASVEVQMALTSFMFTRTTPYRADTHTVAAAGGGKPINAMRIDSTTGRPVVCRNWNRSKCTDTDCERAHVCRSCESPAHVSAKCPQSTKPAAAAAAPAKSGKELRVVKR